jgi:hypothetical protein
MTDEDREEIALAVGAHFSVLWYYLEKKGLADREELTGIMQGLAEEARLGTIGRRVAKLLATEPPRTGLTVIQGGKGEGEE